MPASSKQASGFEEDRCRPFAGMKSFMVIGQPISVESLLLCAAVRRKAGLDDSWRAYHSNAQSSGQSGDDVHGFLRQHGPTHVNIQQLQQAGYRESDGLVTLLDNFDASTGSDLSSGGDKKFVLALTRGAIVDAAVRGTVAEQALQLHSIDCAQMRQIDTLVRPHTARFAAIARLFNAHKWTDSNQAYEPRLLPFVCLPK